VTSHPWANNFGITWLPHT